MTAVNDCRRVINELANDLWRRHGITITRRLLTVTTFASKRRRQRGKNLRLLRAYHDSRLSVKGFAAKIAEKNKSLSRDYRYGPNGSTNAETIEKQIRRLKKRHRDFLSKLSADTS